MHPPKIKPPGSTGCSQSGQIKFDSVQTRLNHNKAINPVGIRRICSIVQTVAKPKLIVPRIEQIKA